MHFLLTVETTYAIELVGPSPSDHVLQCRNRNLGHPVFSNMHGVAGTAADVWRDDDIQTSPGRLYQRRLQRRL